MITPATRWHLVAMAICATAVLLAAAAGWDNSATNDEPYHLLSAHAYVSEGTTDLNPEHPPLTKLVAGLAMLPLDLHGTVAPPVARLRRLAEEVRRFLYRNRAGPLAILRAARTAELVFLLLLLVGVYRWASDLGGSRAGALALLAVASQPLVLGHAFLVHTDVAAAAAWTWTLFLLHRCLAGERGAWVPLGPVLGLALLAKFSSVLILLVMAIALAVHSIRQRGSGIPSRLLGAGAVAFLVVVLGYIPQLRNTDLATQQAVIRAHLALWSNTGAMAEGLSELARLSQTIAQYVLGLVYVGETSAHGQGVNFFLGRLTVAGSPAYFPVAFVLKTTLPFVLMVAAGLTAVVRRRRPGDALPLAAGALYLASSLFSSYNIGARHLMPLLPLLAVVAARRAVTWRPALTIALSLALAVRALLAFPHYIADFSWLAGGPRNGARFLNDSNLDWGQDWVRLARLSRRRGWTPLTYVYLGAGYPGAHLLHARDFLADDGPPEPGLYAVSSYAATVGPAYLKALRAGGEAARLQALLATLHQRGEEVAEVGHTIQVIRLTEAPSQPP